MKIILRDGEEIILDNVDIEIVSGRIVANHYMIDSPGGYSQINELFNKLGIQSVKDEKFSFSIQKHKHGNQNKQ